MFSNSFITSSLSQIVPHSHHSLEAICELARLQSGKLAAIYSIEQGFVIKLSDAPKNVMPRKIDIGSLTGSLGNFFGDELSSRLGIVPKAANYFKIFGSNSVAGFLVTERSDPDNDFDPFERRKLNLITGLAQRVLTLEGTLALIARGAISNLGRVVS